MEKKQRENILLLQINMRFPQTSNAWMFAMFLKNFIHSQLLKPIFLSSNRCETQGLPKIIKLQNRLLLVLP